MQIRERVTATIGDVLKFIRKKEGLFQSQLAEELNVGQGYVSALERSNGSIDKYKEVMEKLGYKVIVKINIDLIREDENPILFSVDA